MSEHSAEKVGLTCRQVTAKGENCGHPAKARTIGNMPVCGVHARAAFQRGEQIRPLSLSPEKGDVTSG